MGWVHKSAKSTNQKLKSQQRSNSKDKDESTDLLCDLGDFFTYGNSLPGVKFNHTNKYIKNSGVVIANNQVLFTNNSGIGIIQTHVGNTLNFFNKFNMLSESFSNLMANVSFDTTSKRWIAICGQLEITAHANDMESVIQKLEELLKDDDRVSEDYHLSVNFHKYVSKGRSNFNASPMPIFSNSNDKFFYFWGYDQTILREEEESTSPKFNILKIAHKRQHTIKESALKSAKELASRLQSKLGNIQTEKDEEINEFPHINIEKLARLAEEESYTMPQGLTREQIIEWARKNQK